ncbi:hypothetical protein [Endozoicomonas sp.]|uniref:hypothetical protein n=1 Tax=Endozoicomonas sp. TaxID=1892382 RepID=UPI0028864894|nr:hypothetical protein [Endozoicomonas sp.]
MLRSLEGLFVSAQSDWVMTYENISHLTDDQQDLLCQISTGSAYVKRTAYTDADETVLSALRPQIINGISPMATRLDLIDRCISTELPSLASGSRKTKTDLEQAFTRDQPALLGALLTLLADATARLPTIKLDKLPRMADFSLLGEAVCPVLGSPASLMPVFQRNTHELIDNSLEGSPVANALVDLCQQRGEGQVFNGIISHLLKQLNLFKTDFSGWPKSPRGLGNILRREQGVLKQKGIEVNLTGKSNLGRTVDVVYKAGDRHAPPTLRNRH